ncbi:MAG TPA: hypothetical protein VMV23_13555 [Candidatus Nanopelagicaceae bacterium]|nr:hypothetical protein [Candidatus Nanopelagicaceae bacterium]
MFYLMDVKAATYRALHHPNLQQVVVASIIRSLIEASPRQAVSYFSRLSQKVHGNSHEGTKHEVVGMQSHALHFAVYFVAGIEADAGVGCPDRASQPLARGIKRAMDSPFQRFNHDEDRLLADQPLQSISGGGKTEKVCAQFRDDHTGVRPRLGHPLAPLSLHARQKLP